ncbi:hypothetical protein ACFL58_02205 [Elusimicrobiota bacterium]
MKRTLLLLFSIIFCAMSAFAEVKIAPYYSIQFDQGIAIPTKGEWMYSADLTNDIGVILEPTKNHQFVTFYELKYSGPGLKTEEGEKFTDRSMDHILVLQHNFDWKENYVLKSAIDHITEYTRTGTNEVWGTGLYDYLRYGFNVTLERKFNKDLSVNFNVQYHLLDYPNYTDILAEFQAGGEAIESSTGKQNQIIYQLGASTKYKKLFGAVDFSLMDYTKQRVVVDTVQDDQTYYSGNKQRDDLITIDAGYELRLWERISFVPAINYKYKTSNQNYQHFDSASSTVPVTYISDYYDYTQLNISFPIQLTLSKKWSFFCNPSIDVKTYLNRPPRDANNVFLTGNQHNELYVLGTGLTKQQNDVTKMTLFYTYQTQSSNMKYERYFPYNYAGHYFGISFNYTY